MSTISTDEDQTPRPTMADLEGRNAFVGRHIGPTSLDLNNMLPVIGVGSLDELIDRTVPADIRIAKDLDLPSPAGQQSAQDELRKLASANRQLTSLIGMGYNNTITPPVIRRNIMENPGWYTAYTPYQPEISQGRLEALLNFQTMVIELTGMEIANASLLDEGTAAAEAMTMLHRIDRGKHGTRFLVDGECHPQTIAVMENRARPIGLEVAVGDPQSAELDGVYAMLVQYPGTTGEIPDLSKIISRAHAEGVMVAVSADPLGLTVLTPPGELGADVVLGSTQRFGVPMGFGGPHAAYFATLEKYQRAMPGRLVGVSVDTQGRPAMRLALQTREQHIRREKATSNICTSQVLLAVMASMYAIHHGPAGLTRIAMRISRMAAVLAAGLRQGGVEVVHDSFFDTVCARIPGRADKVMAVALSEGLNLRRVDSDTITISLDETTDQSVIERVWHSFGLTADTANLDRTAGDQIPDAYTRSGPALTHEIFSAYHSETELVRYMRRLVNRDIALDRAMIPLGSCTMKLNAATEMEPISWPELATIHPFVPVDQTIGYQRIIDQLEHWLVEITGYSAVSLQPNSGAQGELAGLLAVRNFHHNRGDDQRNVSLIPASAHGTNAASSAMAGFEVVVVACDDHGNVDLDDLDAKIAKHRDHLAVLMITYPSTHGVFETEIRRICAAVHEAGGQVYLDGANLNAMVGLARPGKFGADVSHLNLHKTFCIPHGGGGPGVGPIGVGAHLAPFLPRHPLNPVAGPPTGPGPIAAAPWGSASILAISWMYIKMMGAKGLAEATKAAILNANYIAARLESRYPVLYSGADGFVAHECILDTRVIQHAAGISVDDIAKRLIDYGFHAPTMSFPVHDTLMVEPTESESLAELDRFCDAMIAIHDEALAVQAGTWPADDNPLVNAPHTVMEVAADDWDHAYTRTEAAHPEGWALGDKYWPPVSRIDNAYGDRNLVCSCPPMSDWISD